MSKDYKDVPEHRVGPSSYGTEYPHNRVQQIGGHLIEIDATPGKERIKIAHASGTHFEVQSDGKMTMYNVGNHETYTKGGETKTVDNNSDSGIRGHSRSNSFKGSHDTKLGDGDGVTGGATSIIVIGNSKVTVAGEAYIATAAGKNMNINCGGSVDMKVAGDMTMETKGTHTIKAAKITMNP